MEAPPPIALAISQRSSFIADKTFIEQIPYHFVEQLSQNDCLKDKWDLTNYTQQIASQSYMNERDQLRSYLANYNKKLNGFSVKYHKARHKWGRVFPAKSLGLTSFAKKTRNTLIKDLYYDFDLSNAQPQILRNICKANGITHTIIEKYCFEREKIMADIVEASQGLVDREKVKSLIIRLSFYGGFVNWLKELNIDFPEPIIVKNYRTQVQEIANKLKIENPELYKTMERCKKEKGGTNFMGSFLSTYLQEYELRIVENVLSKVCLETNICSTDVPNYFIATYEFDGLKLLKERVDAYGGVDAVLLLMNNANLEMGFDIKWEVKPFEKFYDITFTDPPKSLKEQEKQFKEQEKETKLALKERQKQLKSSMSEEEDRIKEEGQLALRAIQLEEKKVTRLAYLKMKQDFELTHFKIINKASFMQKDEKKFFMRTKKQMIEAYEHLVYYQFTNEDGDDIQLHFISEWIKDPQIKNYIDVGVYPNNEKCPKNFLNMWIPFAMEVNRVEGPCDDVSLSFILNHLLILCDNDKVVHDYFSLWIAQMIQYPEFKSTCPILIGHQGGGKGTFMELMKKLLGDEKVLITAQPDKHVWGNFNTLMANAFLVGLDEMTKSMTTSASEFIKNLITDPKININDKGHSAYMLESYHHFMMMTNKEDGGISTEKGDRRKLMIRISDELVGNKTYFDTFYAYLDDPVVMRNVYDYFKNMKDVPQMLPPPPGSEFQDNLKSLTENHYIRWLKDFVMTSFDEKQLLCTEGSDFYIEGDDEFCCQLFATDFYKRFCKWRDTNGETFDTTPLKMGVNLKNMRVKGIEKGKATNKGVKTKFNLTVLKKSFGLGCLIEL
jgi:energy-coupling factor transporter ATP-binding protein EcfA2